jgi:outer membrane biosynthesis protein TonB
MSRYLPPETSVPEAVVAVSKAAPRAIFDIRPWMLLGMGLAGILTVAIIVTADQSNAGIDGLRAVRALVPQNETDQPDVAQIPFLGRLVAVIHDVAPDFFAPTPDAMTARPAPSDAPADASSPPANSPPPSSQPTAAPLPAAQLPVSTTPPPSVTPPPTPSASPSPSPVPSSPAVTPGPTAPPSGPTPTPAPTATPAPTPAPMLAITTDRGTTAAVNLTGLVPGDSIERAITVQNSGNVAFRYTISATQTASTLLWTDTTNGLQLVVRTSGSTVLYSGPLSGLGTIAGPTALAPATSELLRYTFYFPGNASNAFQGLVQDLALVFDAVEFP